MYIIAGIVLSGLIILYRVVDYYSRRYLGFDSDEHVPVCTPGLSTSPVLVCVLGWGGCRRRQLKRLLEFYSSNNIPTVSWTNPIFNYIFGMDTKHIEHLLDFLIHETHTSTKTIIVHAHSNNGALVWSYMIHIMKTNEQYNQLLTNIKGFIFDSGPLVRMDHSSIWLLEAAVISSYPCVSVILNQAKYIHPLWSPLMIYYTFVRLFYRRYFSANKYSPNMKLLELLHAMPTNIKQYYLYSKSDRLIPYTAIEQFMAKQVERRCSVMSHKFNDSGHVNHFRLHSEEYGDLVLNFIQKI